MANTYYKMLVQKMEDVRKSSIINELQADLRNSAKSISENNIYDFVNKTAMNASENDVDINTLLKYYLVNQILKDHVEVKPEKEEKEERFKDTNNQSIKYNTQEKKYIKNDKAISSLEEIIGVNEDGSYETCEKRYNSTTINRTYSADDCVMNIKLYYSGNEVVKDKNLAIKLLGLRKEFAEKYKYSGYSGESKDLAAAILNKFSPLKETGFYMDSSCNLYRWDSCNCMFVVKTHSKYNSPLLTDYLFKENDIVVRKEYTGRK